MSKREEKIIDECKYLSGSWCDLSDNPCFKDTGGCDTWNDILKEEAEE